MSIDIIHRCPVCNGLMQGSYCTVCQKYFCLKCKKEIIPSKIGNSEETFWHDCKQKVAEPFDWMGM